MDSLRIKGGRELKGEVEISGSKNAALPIMTAALLTQGRMELKNVPDLRDVGTMGALLTELGADVKRAKHSVAIDASGVKHFEAAYELVKTMRASVLVLGPLLARYGKARVSLPGGCAIGARPVNLHIKGLREMGASIDVTDGYVVAKVRRLKGARIYLDMPTVTGTENLMMAATLAKGQTVIENAAREPEIIDLADALVSMGARINGAGQSIIEVEGVDELSPCMHTVIPDRIEAGTYMAAAGVTGGSLLLKNVKPGHLDAVLLKFKEAGLDIRTEDGGLRVKGPRRPVSADLRTMPYPGFPTDMQAQFMVLMSIAGGASIINETIFENRFMHVPELLRMGADIKIRSAAATVRGVKKLKAAEVMATDLRASASLVLAALAADGVSTIHRLYHLDRGYERIEEKLGAVGADVKRVKKH